MAKRSRSTSESRRGKRRSSSSDSNVPKTLERKEVRSPVFSPDNDKWDGEYEFGGPWGCFCIMLFSHAIMYYFYICVEKYEGSLVYPGHAALGGGSFVDEFAHHFRTLCFPTWWTFGLLSAYFGLEYFFAVVLPGPVTKGLPVPSEGHYQFRYKCNALWAWYIILLLAGVLHFTGIFPLWTLRQQFGQFMTAAIIWGDGLSIAIYVVGLKRAIRMSGNPVYDFFMGSCLNPRLPGGVDIKIFAELRNSWVLLFLLTTSCAAEMYRQYQTVTWNMIFMIVAHLLYVNACQKGEECVPTTWDIYYEKFGWMLIFWNFAGVPFLYCCLQPLFIQNVLKTYQHPHYVLVVMFIILFSAYYVFDTVNSQKNRFRMKRQGVDEAIIRRRTFPQFSFGYIENPRTLKSERGELFADGWYRYGRKMHYTADIIMSFLWGASCGFSAFIPFYYFCFFVTLLFHRERRDDQRCRKKYGPLWDEYVKLVPYKFVPGVY